MSHRYHLCKGFEACVMGYWTLRNFDFFFATSMVWLATVFLIIFPYEYRHWETVLNVIGLLAVAIVQFAMPGEHAGVAIFSAVSLLIIIVYVVAYVVYRYRRGQRRWLPPYNWFWLCVAAMLLTLSTTLYTFQNYWLSAYWGTHADWHIMAALGWCALLLARPRRSQEWGAKPCGNLYVKPVPVIGGTKKKT